MPNTAISVKHLTKIYKLYDKPIDRLKEALHPLKKQYHKEFYALNDVSFEIKKGETVGIIGKNGAGKSTLLKIITGVLTPTSGGLHVNGRIASLLELGAGFNPEYTGIENIYFQGSLMGYTKEEMETNIKSIIAFADIGDFINQPVKMYSSGMFARLSFAVAINVDPDILIVDEALSVGDMNFQAKCMTAMDRIKQKGTTILFVSHDINSIKSLCSRGIYIKNGVLNSMGKASEIVEAYMKEMRESLNKASKNNIHEVKEKNKNNQNIQLQSNNSIFKISEEFDKKVAQFRYGTGDIKVKYVEVIDLDGYSVIEAGFNQEVIIKIYLESYIESDNITVAFILFDDKKIEITSSNFQLNEKNLLRVFKGEKYLVEYALKLPLQMNVYSIQVVIANIIVKDLDIIYIDVVPDAYIFKMARREDATLWSKVYLFPSLTIKKLN